ncbi:30S ribosomal protein S7 [bacterium]|nr:30S ribosomal protein S7 [bacterium]|tara:strand:+ start:19541 stop:20011 length:471 start_codon:yes stop_codon:yes gene_type:complete
MRRPLKKKHTIEPDSVYDSVKVTKLINYIMERGKKDTARKIVYAAFEELKGKDSKEDPLALFETAIKNVAPLMEVRSRRVGGANYQVPREVRPERRLALALRWIVEAAKSGKGNEMQKRLADEIRKAANDDGEAVRKRENTHKMAEANKAFAHFAW